MNNSQDNRVVWLDWLRVLACLMVMIVHATEPFYLGGEGSRILTPDDAFWAAFSDSSIRSCVPLFVIASSYLLFPVKEGMNASSFLRRRLSRLLVPFLLWSLVYAFVWGAPVENLRGLLLNFNYAAGHLWFVYMLLGVYLLMPLLSPWASRVSRSELRLYLFLWVLTLFIPFIREWASGGELNMILGPTGIPNPAAYPLWGEASWNAYGTFYYVSGFIGYLLLGLYLRRFVPSLSWSKTLCVSVPSWFVGFGLCFGGFLSRVQATTGGQYPFDGAVTYAVGWETPWFYDSIGVALMALGLVLLFRKFCTSNRLLTAISKASYGMYLTHMLVLATLSATIRTWLGSGVEGRLGFWTTPAEILLTAAGTFCITAIVCTILQRIPHVGKWLMG